MFPTRDPAAFSSLRTKVPPMDIARETPRVLVTDLDTPVVTIDLDRVERNIARVQDIIARSGRGNRPHVKTHKIPAIAAMQIQAGAIGITCQKLGEAAAFIEAGVCDDILISYNIVGEAKTERLMELGLPRQPPRRRRRQRDGAARPQCRGAARRPRPRRADRMRHRLRP